MSVAVEDANPDGDVWVWDFAGETHTRLTVGDGDADYPVWTPDSTRIAYGWNSGDINWKAANNTGSPERFAESPGREGGADPDPYFFVPDGTALVFRSAGNVATGNDIGVVALEDGAEPEWLLEETFNERNAELSPNGRWMAYDSDESGQYEIYVRPFPNIDDDRKTISNAGGQKPLWSRDGSELFYLEPGLSPRLVAATVDGDDTDFLVSGRTALLDWPYRGLGGAGRPYDVSLDG